MKILVLNSGSSTLKTSLYEIAAAPPEDPPAAIWEGLIEWRGNAADARTSTPAGIRSQFRVDAASRERATGQLLADLWAAPNPVLRDAADIHVVGHRIVHGGEEFTGPTRATPRVKDVIRQMSEFAPLHNPAGLEAIEIAQKIFGAAPHIVVFDTAFHRTLPESASTYPGPYEWAARGIRRYGFHGINHEYCAHRAARLLGRDLASLNIVTCHLGNGCSLAAISGGRSVDTTMGFTPLEGLMMGTRTGSIDPSILTYLMRRDYATADEIDDLLNKKSGLAGISGVSGDMREVIAARKSGNARAKLAFDIFIHRLAGCVGSMVAALAGIDALVFTAGIGEHSPDVRAAACANLEFLGIRLDSTKNSESRLDGDISAPDSRVRVLIVRAQEDWAIARACWTLMQTKSGPAGAS